ncbi:MAG: phenylalanine--tRNA ligase subunit beta, partial [Gammaproteobacteria bacterium]
MKFSEKWLRTWINPSISHEILAKQLILAGLEVEAITFMGDDAIFELSITPNRGDCLSIVGIAREIAAINSETTHHPVPLLRHLPLAVGATHAAAISSNDKISVLIAPDAERACPRYISRRIHNINPDKKTPNWMQERLISGGIEPKMPVVDVLNYVMLELGQPMHAFDCTALSGGIQVRMAKPNEQITLLNKQTVTLQPDTVVIADHREAHAIAGVMGGLTSAVQHTSHEILLESAFFMPEAIAGRARRYGLHTDSAYRFERGVDFDLQERAMEYATTLLINIVGGEAEKVVHKTSPYLPILPQITLDIQRVQHVLGINIPENNIIAMLKSLGMQIVDDIQTYKITPPSYRFDIQIPEDLIEEIARLYGYDKIPCSSISIGEIAPRSAKHEGEPLLRLRQLLIDRGYREAITYSFVDPILQHALYPESESFTLANPISPELSVMRRGLWPGL